ncbi:MAG TPA: ferritin-like domain-containing protein [Chloroflexota bacterium]|nr:ferritin-like domain-containing protein [Chloroflexota bacterium]
MNGKDQLLNWLNDAYAMETSITKTLESQAGQAKDNPTMRQAIETHLQQTKQHADLVKSTIESLGGDTSALKTGMANVMGWMQGLSTSPAGDTLVKDSIADFATEHFEIASYRSIIAAAEELGLTQVVQMANQIIPQEERMANFLREHLATVTQEALAKLTAGATS